MWQWDSYAFGETEPYLPTVSSGTMPMVNLRFPGQYYDVESDSHYNWHRYYETSTGRYITSDPVGLYSGLNTFGYVDSNPLLYFDAEGLAKDKGGDGSASGRNTTNPYKHCRQHPTKPNKLLCKRKRDGKWITVPKPLGWDEQNSLRESCGENCKKLAATITVGGTSYLVYRCIRLLPSLLPPLWPTIAPNLAMP